MNKPTSLVVLLCLIGAGSLAAQVPSKTSPVAPPPEERTRPQARDRALPPADDPARVRTTDRQTSTGNPEGELHPGNTTVLDTAVGRLVLDPSQLDRIRAMDERYNAELRDERISRSDPAYANIIDRRAREMETILTPAQYERWSVLSGRVPPQTGQDAVRPSR